MILKDRSIHNNIRLIFDLIEYSHLIEEDGFILFWISIRRPLTRWTLFYFSTVEHFGFGPKMYKYCKNAI